MGDTPGKPEARAKKHKQRDHGKDGKSGKSKAFDKATRIKGKKIGKKKHSEGGDGPTHNPWKAMGKEIAKKKAEAQREIEVS
jgi:hypothetical protein